ncbi:uncharacterized protein CC84DRAFT_576672 [Paraphaeosphaeria sporulosa]|uniref:Uncharacterized protein n=1 Tax=Paraphaeosphaeria sporulosa TaxID=1460663 RepID=A0A177CN50_9PLEO|nr:uncharacterized protein CC84DRAFT_576672 [Paraphaeosphaeria sporulosa]OAG08412.1 hypothetical protein CC84DRAFT_576672 [Paraphaeosphaeria sporulosa]
MRPAPLHLYTGHQALLGAVMAGITLWGAVSWHTRVPDLAAPSEDARCAGRCRCVKPLFTAISPRRRWRRRCTVTSCPIRTPGRFAACEIETEVRRACPFQPPPATPSKAQAKIVATSTPKAQRTGKSCTVCHVTLLLTFLAPYVDCARIRCWRNKLSAGIAHAAVA